MSARSVSINILSAGGMQSNSESDRQIPGGVMQFIRSLFPGGEIHVEDGSADGIPAASSHPDQARTSSVAEPGPEAEPTASEEGIFLSNVLRQIMPLLAGQAGSESGAEPANASEHAIAQDSSAQVSTIR